MVDLPKAAGLLEWNRSWRSWKALPDEGTAPAGKQTNKQKIQENSSLHQQVRCDKPEADIAFHSQWTWG